MNTPLPDWLSQPQPHQSQSPDAQQPPPVGHVGVAIRSLNMPTHQMTQELRQLERQTFEIAFEMALEAMAEGVTLQDFCREYHTQLSPARFRNWMFKDANRSVAYRRAKMIGAEAVEDELLRISDGKNPDGTASISDTNRDTLRINIRKWLLGVWNRKKYGDIKQVEQHVTPRFDPATATADELRSKLMEMVGMGDATPANPLAPLEGEVLSINDLIEEIEDESDNSQP